MIDNDVFFLDRVSRGTLTLAREAAARGAVVMFEPSSKTPENLLAEALGVSHVVKYAETRERNVRPVMSEDSGSPG